LNPVDFTSYFFYVAKVTKSYILDTRYYHNMISRLFDYESDDEENERNNIDKEVNKVFVAGAIYFIMFGAVWLYYSHR
jgi:hypothetical protein